MCRLRRCSLTAGVWTEPTPLSRPRPRLRRLQAAEPLPDYPCNASIGGIPVKRVYLLLRFPLRLYTKYSDPEAAERVSRALARLPEGPTPHAALTASDALRAFGQ